MKDQRLKVFRGALDGLIESLDATLRVARWSEQAATQGADQGPPPEPLQTAASKLNERLGTAGRLSSGTFLGSPADTHKVSTMTQMMKRLDAAYVSYRKCVESTPLQSRDAAATLEAELAEVARDSGE